MYYTGKIYSGSDCIFKLAADTRSGLKHKMLEFLRAQKAKGRLSNIDLCVSGPNDYWFHRCIN